MFDGGQLLRSFP
jgi:hypothetical protein